MKKISIALCFLLLRGITGRNSAGRNVNTTGDPAKVSGVKKIKNRPIRTMYGFFATFVKSPNSESPVHR